ncbi:hypothetical protein [Arthrobacter sp. VKM Ac-2550]|uniref:hypothetical protein n=1 Tax=Crystallibacter permensis TaxID=1938888 RepID=UPI00222694D4|nr:hypothetical protein [Arthrobacter sp. VKM Ac-2550]MCW2131489.1 hypothetical protein [Arthrobacter sp. VKM Ac-2550]
MKLSQYSTKAGTGYIVLRGAGAKPGTFPGAWQDGRGTIHVPGFGSLRACRAAVLRPGFLRAQKAGWEGQCTVHGRLLRGAGPQVVSVTREAAGRVHDERPNLMKLLRSEDRGAPVVKHCARLARAGHTRFEVFLALEGLRVEAADLAQTSDQSDGFLSLMYSFTAGLYGLRGSRRRSKKLIVALDDEAAGK